MLQVFWALRPRIHLKGDTSFLLCIHRKGRLARGTTVLASPAPITLQASIMKARLFTFEAIGQVGRRQAPELFWPSGVWRGTRNKVEAPLAALLL